MISICHKASKLVLRYNLDKDTEINSISCSKDSKIFFNSSSEFMVADPEIGIINLETKDVLHEYHLDRTWSKSMNVVDMSFG